MINLNENRVLLQVAAQDSSPAWTPEGLPVLLLWPPTRDRRAVRILFKISAPCQEGHEASLKRPLPPDREGRKLSSP